MRLNILEAALILILIITTLIITTLIITTLIITTLIITTTTSCVTGINSYSQNDAVLYCSVVLNKWQCKQNQQKKVCNNP